MKLYSYPMNCGNEPGGPIPDDPGIAPGSSDLQSLGDGYWQFNWKNLKAYANSCRAMYVEFDGGATSPVVKFQFKK